MSEAEALDAQPAEGEEGAATPDDQILSNGGDDATHNKMLWKSLAQKQDVYGQKGMAINNQISRFQRQKHLYTKNMQKVIDFDEHMISIQALCLRLGYRAEYFLDVGLTIEFVQSMQEFFGKNEEFEKNYREYKRQQRLAFMPMHRSLSQFVIDPVNTARATSQ